jgi:2-haloacid dehalogenase
MHRDTILFDINETVLDLSSLKPLFAEYLGGESMSATWFSMLLHSSNVCALTGVRSDFGSLAGVTLDTLAARVKLKLDDKTKQKILGTFATMPAHPDIPPALETLKAAGYRTIAFTNSSTQLVTSQITNSGLLELFDQLISVESTGSFKPDPAVYEFAAEQSDRPVESLRLVATHDWDTHGALCAGMKAAYIDRTGAPYHPLYRRPDAFATTMTGLVKQIIELDSHPNIDSGN